MTHVLLIAQAVVLVSDVLEGLARWSGILWVGSSDDVAELLLRDNLLIQVDIADLRVNVLFGFLHQS